MKKQFFLYHLIQSLTKSEKRYFKLYTGRTESSINKEYMLLYKLILNVKSYDEAILKKKSKIKNFAYQKKYLYDLVLRCLVDYNHQEKKNNIGKSSLMCAELLFAKGLVYQALNQLKKQKKLAYKTELFGEVVDIIEVEQKILSSRMDVHNTKPEFLLLAKEKTDVLTKITAVSKMEVIGVNLLNIAHHSKNNKGEKATAQYHQIIAEMDSLKNELSSLRCQLHYFRIKGSSYYLLGDYYKAISYYEREITVSIRLQINISNKVFFCSKLNTLANIYNRLRLPKEFNRTVNLLEKTVQEIGSKSLKNRYELTMYILRLNFNILIKDWNSLTSYLETIPTDLSKYINDYQNSCNILRYNTSCGYFYVANYKKSLFWINQVLSANYKEMMPEVNAAARLINLVIHYQLGNFMLLENLINSYKKTDQKVSIYAPFEKVLLKFLTQLIQSPYQKKQILEAFIPKLLKFKQHKTQAGIYTLFEFENWWNSLIK